MPTVTVYTAARMKEIEDGGVVDAQLVSNELILIQFDGTQINTGPLHILTSPNGTQYQLLVGNDGTLSTVAI